MVSFAVRLVGRVIACLPAIIIALGKTPASLRIGIPSNQLLHTVCIEHGYGILLVDAYAVAGTCKGHTMPKTAENPTLCRGTTTAGKPCSARAQPGHEWCQWHDPARESERAQWRSEGGLARSHRNTAARELKRYPVDMGSLRGTLFHALKRVEAGELEPGVANSMATLARAIVTVSQSVDVEERLAALEQRAEMQDVA